MYLKFNFETTLLGLLISISHIKYMKNKNVIGSDKIQFQNFRGQPESFLLYKKNQYGKAKM